MSTWQRTSKRRGAFGRIPRRRSPRIKRWTANEHTGRQAIAPSNSGRPTSPLRTRTTTRAHPLAATNTHNGDPLRARVDNRGQKIAWEQLIIR